MYSKVIEDKAKELVEALVTNQIDVEEGTDIVSGKRNGLFIFCTGLCIYLSWHGSKLTSTGAPVLVKPLQRRGKTERVKTLETLILIEHSVAEVAQRPLYRVTCGGVGTNAEDVERVLPFPR